MSPLPSQEQLRQRKMIEHAELVRRQEREDEERRGLAEALARYWELLGEFVVRAGELGIQPGTYEPSVHRRSETRVDWVEGFRLRSGSILSAPPLRYSLRERRLVHGPRIQERVVEEVSLFVLTTDAGLTTALSEPKTRSGGNWPPVRRWDRACNVLLALEAELEATLLELMDADSD
jgi:hypothetical protein